MDKGAVLKTLNRIMEFELAGVVRYTHYALMVYGYNRIPIVEWLKAQATESLDHARQALALASLPGATSMPSTRLPLNSAAAARAASSFVRPVAVVLAMLFEASITSTTSTDSRSGRQITSRKTAR